MKEIKSERGKRNAVVSIESANGVIIRVNFLDLIIVLLKVTLKY